MKGKHQNYKSPKYVAITIALVVCFVALVIVAITIFTKEESESLNRKETASSLISENQDLVIDTPYCELHFPSEWNGYIYTSVEQNDQAYKVIFTGILDEQKVDLFSVVFGDSTEMPIGTLIQSDGSEVVVRLNVDLFNPAGLSEQQISLAYEIMEDNTYLIEALSELDNFQ